MIASRSRQQLICLIFSNKHTHTHTHTHGTHTHTRTTAATATAIKENTPTHIWPSQGIIKARIAQILLGNDPVENVKVLLLLLLRYSKLTTSITTTIGLYNERDTMFTQTKMSRNYQRQESLIYEFIYSPMQLKRSKKFTTVNRFNRDTQMRLLHYNHYSLFVL